MWNSFQGDRESRLFWLLSESIEKDYKRAFWEIVESFLRDFREFLRDYREYFEKIKRDYKERVQNFE